MTVGTTTFLSVVGPFVWKFIFPEMPMFPFGFLVLGIVAVESTNVVPMPLFRICGKAIASIERIDFRDGMGIAITLREIKNNLNVNREQYALLAQQRFLG